MVKQLDPASLYSGRVIGSELSLTDDCTLVSILSVLRQRIFCIIIILAISMAGAFSYLALASPRFTATATLLIDTKKAQPFAKGAAPDAMVDAGTIESQIELLRSEKIAISVIQKMVLAHDPEFASKGTMLGIGFSDESEESAIRRALITFQKSVDVRRAGRSYVAQVSFTSKDPRKAARIANEIANAYITDHLDARIYNTQRSRDWIKSRLYQLQENVARADAALTQFRAESSQLVQADRITTAEREMKLQELESTKETYRTIFDTFLNLSRYVQTIQEHSFPVTEARLLSEAAPPLLKSSPKWSIVLPLAMMIGVGLGVAAAFWRENVDRTVRSMDQLERLGVKCLASLPSTREYTAVASGSGGLQFPALYEDHRAYIGAADALRASRHAIDSATGKESGKIIGITSPRSSEGKTTFVINLAAIIHKSGKRALLIDADMRRRCLTKMLSADNEQGGLLNALEEQRTFDYAIRDWRFGHFLPCHLPSEFNTHPADVINSPAMRELLIIARPKYDYVLVALPSVLRHSDVRTSAHLMDAFILLAACKSTTIDDIQACLLGSPDFVGRLVGVVLNKTPTSSNFPLEKLRKCGLKEFLTLKEKGQNWVRNLKRRLK